MNKLITALLFLFTSFTKTEFKGYLLTTNQGHVSFFSHTAVENIQAVNNQVLSVIDLSKNEIAISILMNAFVFEKALMQEHFSTSYMETDLYPKATFEGEILGLNLSAKQAQTRLIKGKLTIRNITKDVTVKARIEKKNGVYVFEGDLDILISDFKIKIPPILSPNIAKNINAKFKFEYYPDEK